MTHTDHSFPDVEDTSELPDSEGPEPEPQTLDDLLLGSPGVDDSAAWTAAGAGAWAAADTDVQTEVDGEPVLASPPSTTSDEDLAAALNAPPPSTRSLRLTRVLATSLVVVLAFAGGVWANQQWGTSGQQAGAQGPFGGRGQQGELSSGFPQGFPGANGPGDGAAAGAGSGAGTNSGVAATSATAPTTGEVTLVDGEVIYLKDSSGNQVRVEVKDSTDITASRDADLSDVQKGDTVTVTGTTGDSGLEATSVEISK